MYGRIPGNHISSPYMGTRVAIQEIETPSGGCGQATTTTRILPRAIERSCRPHMTEYNNTGSNCVICRCSNPEAHGDAFTRRNHVEVHEGEEIVDVAGNAIGWEDYMHRLMDAAGKDRINAEEVLVLSTQVLRPDAVDMKRRKRRYAQAMDGSRVKFWIESNVIWHGRINPRRHPIVPVHEIPTGIGAATVYDRYGTLPGAYSLNGSYGSYGPYPRWGGR